MIDDSSERTAALKALFLTRYNAMREEALQSLSEIAVYGKSIPQDPHQAYTLGFLAALQHLDYADVFWDSLLEEYANSIN